MDKVCHIYVHERVRARIHTHTGMLFNYKKEENPLICDNTDEAGGHYAK